MITLETGDGEKVDFYVLEETRISGMNYLLVTDAPDDADEGECYILKDRSKAEEEEAVYEFVEDDDELDYLYRIFTELFPCAESRAWKSPNSAPQTPGS